MEKNLRFAIWGLAGFLLLGLACNMPEALTGNDPGADRGPTNIDGAETIRIPGGTFRMGSTSTDLAAGEDELPDHPVTLETFYLYTHEVTNEMYAACLAAGACPPVNQMESGPTLHYPDPAFADYPVVGVDWNMADDYCTWAGGRLPTEAEWEYAARGTDSLLYPWGADDPACDRLNMFGCLVPPDTAAVGSYALGNSPYEVWDLAGNVWEWVHDWYDPDYYFFSPTSSPLGPNTPDIPADPLKVVRGGGLYSEPVALRSAKRGSADPLRAFDDVGFRCVAEGALALPGDYVPVPEGHEMVPPGSPDGGGEHVEDPDNDIPWFRMGHSIVSCPDPAGRMHLFVEADSSETVVYSVTVDGVAFDCYYDEMLRGLQCEGPVPAVTEFPDEFHVQVHFHPGGIGHSYPDKPLDCPVEWAPPSGTATASCPGDDGLVTISIETDPPLAWDTTQVVDGGELMDIPCWSVGDGEMRCTVPARVPGDLYFIYLHGSNEDGDNEWVVVTGVPEDCPVGMRDVTVFPTCSEAGPAVQVMYVPTSDVLASVSTVGVPLHCIGWAPGVQVCGVLPGEAGSPSTVTTCFAGETCENWPINVPDCSGPAQGYISDVTPTCYEGLGPVVVIHYVPGDQPLVAANANGADLSCYDAVEPGWYMCSGIPGAPGSEKTVTYCLADGTCFSDPITVSDCGVALWGEDWRLIAVGCHDATQLYFMVDTGLDWLVPGADVTYTASDGESTYSCSVHPTVAGRVYCAGMRTPTPGDLQFCIQRPGEAAPTCQTFPEFAIWVNEVPPCAPIPAEPVINCADYLTWAACNEHSDVCVFNKTCEPKP